ncbi:hypothetical protein, partial [Kitasatospora albolonga]|uniref:hypothetical protein n=1 Tax=Kitasatospora albolonga TaxID=68173 RepID=UPI0031EC00E6
MELFDTAVVLTRVLTSGTVMSIEKSDRELPGLERQLTKITGRRKAVLVNTRTAAVHAALTGQEIGYGDTAVLPGLDGPTAAFVSWLGVTVREAGETPSFVQISLDGHNAHRLGELARTGAAAGAPALVVDLTGLGFGPAAAVLTDDPRIWAPGRAAQDLRCLRPAHHVDPGGGEHRARSRSPVQLPPQPAGGRLRPAGPPSGRDRRPGHVRSNDVITDFPAAPLPLPDPAELDAQLAEFGGDPIIAKELRRTIFPVITKEDVFGMLLAQRAEPQKA